MSTRRRLLIGALASGGATLLAACRAGGGTSTGGQPTSPAATSTAPSSAPAPPTAAPSPAPGRPGADAPPTPSAPSPTLAAATPDPATAEAEAATPTARPAPIVLYTGLSGSIGPAVVAEFERLRPSYELRIQPLPSSREAQARVLAERAAPKADLLLGGPSALHAALAREGLLESFRSPATDALPARLRDPGGAWTGWYADVLAVLINRDRYRVDLRGVEAPQDWDGLLRPDFKGRLALPDPASTDAGYLFLAGQLFRLGRDEGKALDYMRQLHAQVDQYAPTEAALTQAVAQGQATLGVGWAHDALAAADRGEPVVLPSPPDLLFDVGAVSLIKGGPNPSGARALMEWLVGKEAGQLVVAMASRPAVVKGVEPPSGLTPLDGSALAPYDPEWAAENRARLVAAWRAAVGR